MISDPAPIRVALYGNQFAAVTSPRVAISGSPASFWRLASIPNEDFEEHGEGAIRICRVEEPTRYLQIIASILPKEFLFENVTGDMDDEQLDDLIAALRQRALEHRQAVALPAPERVTNGHDCA